MNEHGYCPHCKADLDGEDIVFTFMSLGKSAEQAEETAKKYYGYREGHTKWSRRISMYSLELDRTTSYRCPDCEQSWDRE